MPENESSEKSVTPDDEDPNPRDLVRRAKAAPSSGFGALYERIAPALFAWARLRIGPALRRRLDPEDILQETCLRAYGRFASFDAERGSFRAWAFGIANNVLREALSRPREVSTGTKGVERDDGDPADLIPADVTSASRRVVRDEGLARVIERLETLSDEERRLLIHRGLEGMSHAEVAHLLGIGVAAAEKRWQRLLVRLQELGVPEDLVAS